MWQNLDYLLARKIVVNKCLLQIMLILCFKGVQMFLQSAIKNVFKNLQVAENAFPRFETPSLLHISQKRFMCKSHVPQSQPQSFPIFSQFLPVNNSLYQNFPFVFLPQSGVPEKFNFLSLELTKESIQYCSNAFTCEKSFNLLKLRMRLQEK